MLTPEQIMAMLPKPNVIKTPVPTIEPSTASPIPSVPSTPQTQQPVTIQLTIARDDEGRPRTDQHGKPLYIPTPVYGPGYGPAYPAGLPYLPGGGIGTYPGVAGDASIKIGEINSNVSQGNTNWGSGTQALGSTFPVTDMPTGTPLVITTAPAAVTPQFETLSPMIMADPPKSSIGLPTILIGLCLLIALGIAGYYLYKNVFGKKTNNTSQGNARRNTGGANTTTAAAPAAQQPAPGNLEGDEFGNFEDFELTPGNQQSGRR